MVGSVVYFFQVNTISRGGVAAFDTKTLAWNTSKQHVDPLPTINAAAVAAGNSIYLFGGGWANPGQVFQCADGWAGDTCTVCDADRFGHECTPCMCPHGSCGPSGYDATPVCTPGGCDFNWMGANCSVCAPHFTAPDNNCTNCLPAYFGQKCDQPCTCGPRGVSNSSGPNGTGHCNSCQAGWAGDDCKDCDSLHFGLDCQTCSCGQGGTSCQSGLHGNGHCTSCNVHWTGDDCNDCDAQFFGEYCNTPCTCVHGTVNSSGINGTGHCTECVARYSGPDCTLCDGKADPATCTTQYAGRCDDPVIGKQVASGCPSMCNTCGGVKPSPSPPPTPPTPSCYPANACLPPGTKKKDGKVSCCSHKAKDDEKACGKKGVICK